MPGNIDTAITWKDTGATYIFKVISENHDFDDVDDDYDYDDDDVDDDEEDCGNSHGQNDH